MSPWNKFSISDEEICFVENLTSWGLNICVKQFNTQFTHVSRPLEFFNFFKNSSGKTVLKVWSQIVGKMAVLVQFEKKAKS